MSRTRILVVEDDTADARFVRELFVDSPISFDVVHATDLTSAAHEFDRSRPDLVLLDLSLPDTDGVATVSLAKARLGEVPIVVMTGLDDQEIATDAVHAGAQDYIVKGQVTAAGLARAVSNAIERHQDRQRMKELLAQQEHMNDQLRALAAMKDDFVTIASHELRTPVTVIRGFLELLDVRWDGLGEDQRREMISHAHRNACRLAELTEDLLLTSRLDGRTRQTSRVSRVDVATAIREGLDTSRADPACVTLHVPDALTCLAEPKQLSRIVRNFVDNAVSHGGEPIEIRVTSRNGNVEIRVRDHGPGVQDSFVEHLFDRFTQASAATTREESGSGLGLSIVHGLAQSMGGDAWYEHGDPGAIFVVSVPAGSEVTSLRPAPTPAVSQSA